MKGSGHTLFYQLSNESPINHTHVCTVENSLQLFNAVDDTFSIHRGAGRYFQSSLKCKMKKYVMLRGFFIDILNAFNSQLGKSIISDSKKKSVSNLLTCH